MKIRLRDGIGILLGILLVGVIVASGILPVEVGQASTWQQMSSPGQLSGAHAFLENNCAACHTPVKGVQGVNCITCHAGNAGLLQRQPTAFHADIVTCTSCHIEHLGGRTPTKMDHAALARYGLSQLKAQNASDPQSLRLRQHIDQNGKLAGNNGISAFEATLNCVTCHATKDRHRGSFGTACASCHSVAEWTIPEFRHPSPNSRQCVQCHQAPRSHYMMHFKMVSAKVARQPKAKVSQCYTCHQTTVWNDIKGVGWYDHH